MLKVVGASWFQTKISTYLIAGMAILGVVSLFIGEIERIEGDGNYAATVYWSQKSNFRIDFWGQGNELEEVPRGASRAHYRSDIKENGWSKLEIESNSQYPDWVQAYASGLLEGALTWQMIHWHWKNTIEPRCQKYPDDCRKIREILKTNMDAVRARSFSNEDTFWHQISLFYHQLDGLSAGYNYIVKKYNNDEFEISIEDIIWLNSFSDVAVIERVHNITNGARPGRELPGLASAFIRLIPDQPVDQKPSKEKIIAAHNSAGSYNTMLRIMKRYKLQYHRNVLPTSATIPGTTIVFAGFPAAISSQDDMYCITGLKNHSLTVTGTAINNFNPELWVKVNLKDHALIGPRVMAANRLANNGVEWVKSIARVNSGTTPAQWSILNLSQLKLLNASSEPATNVSSPSPEQSKYRYIFTTIDKKLKSLNFSLWRTFKRRFISHKAPGLLWTAEQLPGLTHAADQSIVLRARGYWADYGIPHYQDIRDLSGIRKMEELHGDMYSLTSSPRAILFKNGFHAANDVNTVSYLMRTNHYDDDRDATTAAPPDEEIESDDIVSNSREVDEIRHALKTVKNRVESKDSDNSVSSFLTAEEQEAITAQVNEILEQLKSSEESDESKENLNLDSGSDEEDVSDSKEAVKEGWHGLGARGDLHGWIGEQMYGLIPLGVIDTKVFNSTTDGSSDFMAISGPAYTQTLEKPIESLLTADTRNKGQLSFKELLKKLRQSNLRFVSDESFESEESFFGAPEEMEPLNFGEALDTIVNRTIQIYAPNAVPPFEWLESDFANLSHVGHPDKWRFAPLHPKWFW